MNAHHAEALSEFALAAVFAMLVIRSMKKDYLYSKGGSKIERSEGPLFFNGILLSFSGLSLFLVYLGIKAYLR